MRIALASLASLAVAVAVATAAPAKKPREHGTLVILLDRSGSMQGIRWESAKEATKAAIAALDPSDDVAVIAFDSEALLVVKLQPAGRVSLKEFAKLQPGGGTDYLPALKLARDTLAKQKGTKHVVLLSDGEAPYDGIEDVMTEMSKDHVTLSTIGIGDADRNLLGKLAELGGGSLWMVNDAQTLPKIFTKEVNGALPR